jgi:hypothetical protein
LAVLVLFAVNRRDVLSRAMPAWLDPGQPPDGVAAQLNTLTADQSWAANRARHMTACCADRTAGRRIRRTYPATLAEDPNSFIRATIEGGM